MITFVIIGGKTIYAIKELEFNINKIHWIILVFCNKKIQSRESIVLMLKDKINEEVEIDVVLEELNNENLIYYNDDKTEIVSIINTDII